MDYDWRDDLRDATEVFDDAFCAEMCDELGVDFDEVKAGGEPALIAYPDDSELEAARNAWFRRQRADSVNGEDPIQAYAGDGSMWYVFPAMPDDDAPYERYLLRSDGSGHGEELFDEFWNAY